MQNALRTNSHTPRKDIIMIIKNASCFSCICSSQSVWDKRKCWTPNDNHLGIKLFSATQISKWQTFALNYEMLFIINPRFCKDFAKSKNLVSDIAISVRRQISPCGNSLFTARRNHRPINDFKGTTHPSVNTVRRIMNVHYFLLEWVEVLPVKLLWGPNQEAPKLYLSLSIQIKSHWSFTAWSFGCQSFYRRRCTLYHLLRWYYKRFRNLGISVTM